MRAVDGFAVALGEVEEVDVFSPQGAHDQRGGDRGIEAAAEREYSTIPLEVFLSGADEGLNLLARGWRVNAEVVIHGLNFTS